MCYDIVDAMLQYFDFKYDLMQIFINRLAAVKLLNFLGAMKYDKKEYKKLTQILSFRQRITLFIKILKSGFKRATKKFERTVRRFI